MRQQNLNRAPWGPTKMYVSHAVRWNKGDEFKCNEWSDKQLKKRSQNMQLGEKPFTTQAEGYVKAVTRMFAYSHFYEHLEIFLWSWKPEEQL